MNTKVEADASRFDSFKLLAAIGLLLAAVGAFYYFANESLLFRVLGLVGVAVLSVLIASRTEPGRGFLAFTKGARNEVRKVVWPTRAETMQTTMIVILVVVLVAIFLWLLDMLLVSAVRIFTGQGG